MRLASGLAQAVNFMLGICAEPPFGLHGWTGIYWEKLYMYIYLYNLCIHIYVYTQTQDTHIPPPPTTTTPHMLVTGTRRKRDNKYTARAASLSIKNTPLPELGFVPPCLGNLQEISF